MSNYLYLVTLVQGILSIIIFLPTWFLGAGKVFNWTSEALTAWPTFIRNTVAVVIAIVSFFVVFISWPIGFIELIRRCVAFVKRKAREYSNESYENIPLWYKILTNEHTGLVLAYIVIPLHRFLLMAGVGLLDTTMFNVLFRDMLFVYIPTTVIRFMLKPKGLESISEIFACIILSFSCSFGLYYVFNSIIYFPTIFDEIFVCLVLFYKSKRKENDTNLASYSMWLFLVILAITRRVIRRSEPFPEALTSTVSAILIISPFLFYLFSKNLSEQPDEEPNHTISLHVDEEIKPPSDAPIQEPRQEPQRPPIDIASELTDIGLAHIGRKTTVPNKYLTTERTNERRNVERPFLRLLADRYRDETQRKILARHFMLYKEVTLFLAYSVILKGDKELHYSVRSKLNERLSLGIKPEALKKRNDCWRRISQKFNDEYKRTASMGNALTFSFWSTLAEDNTDWVTHETITEMLANDSLHDIFRYSYKVVEREYKDLAQQSRQQSRQ